MAMNDNTAVTAPAGDYMVRIEGLRKSFGDLEVLRDVNLEVAPGEVVTIIGASGSGKSTLLRCINLLETPDAGHVWFQGSDLTADHVDVNSLREDIGMVFQGFNLFNNMDAVSYTHLLAKDHEIVRLILEYREKTKIKSTYLDTLGGQRRNDGRVHTTYNQTITATGRLSSSNPNLQNIPTRSELGHAVKKAFSVEEGSVFVAIDYSQIELRLLAHLSGDEHLVSAFNEGEDFHAETAARVFGVAVDEVTPQLRSRDVYKRQAGSGCT